MTALFLYTLLMPKDNVSYKLLHSIWKKESIESQERIYDHWVKYLDPDGDLGIAEAELSWEELMWLKDEANKQ
tara:strand:+ start:115 stop:333 length:219 start_codon:yes stop_codon:yes gene_type:complete